MQYSIINLQEIPVESTILRLDSEFFHPKIVKTKRTIRSKEHSTLRKIGATIIHPSEIKREYEETGIQILLAQNIRDNFMDFSVSVFMSNKFEKNLHKNRLEYGDVALTRSGANYGQCAPYLGLPLKIFACADDLVIKRSKLPGTYLSTYLNTSFGKNLIESCKYGGSQPHISPQTLYDIPIYTPSDHLINKIDIQIQNSFESTNNAKVQYHQAQTLLLSELGLAAWQPKQRLTFIGNYSDTQRAGRIDADYFQPKYEEIEKAIKNYPNGYTFIRDEFRHNKSIFNVDKKKLYRYVEIGSVNVSTGEITSSEVLGENLPANAKRVLRKNDVIISKVRTYRGATTIVEENGYVGSGAFCILRENGSINKETLLALLHSKPLLIWSLKPNTGTSYPVIVDDDILNLPIPILPDEKQTQIQQKVIESFNLRHQSKHLLECAKRAVEIAIEQDEHTAIDWLETETS